MKKKETLFYVINLILVFIFLIAMESSSASIHILYTSFGNTFKPDVYDLTGVFYRLFPMLCMLIQLVFILKRLSERTLAFYLFNAVLLIIFSIDMTRSNAPLVIQYNTFSNTVLPDYIVINSILDMVFPFIGILIQLYAVGKKLTKGSF